MNYIISRLKERSTYQGIFGFLTAVGVTIKPELWEAITSVGVACIALVHVLFPESGKAE